MYKWQFIKSNSISQISARPKGRCLLYIAIFLSLLWFDLFFCSFHLFFLLFLDPVHLSDHISRDMSDGYRQTAQSSGKCRYCTLHTSCSFNSEKLVSLKKACHYFVTPCPKWHLQQISLPAKRQEKRLLRSHGSFVVLLLFREKKMYWRTSLISVVCVL